MVGTVDGGRGVWLCRGGGAAQFFHLILCFFLEANLNTI